MKTFVQHTKPLESLNLGITKTYFGFGMEFLDKRGNDGKKHLFISKDFGDKILDFRYLHLHYLKEPFDTTFKKRGSLTKFRCEIRFRYLKDRMFYYAIGTCGDYGFGALFSKKYTLTPYIVKQCLEQLYDHLEEKFNEIKQ